MVESGGSTNQSGILYQNSVAALYLGRLCDMRPRPAYDRVVQVRIEAPECVDDIVVTYADEHRDWIQAKEELAFSGKTWNTLWKDFEKQRWHHNFGSDDGIVLAFGNNHTRYQNLRKLCDRTKGKLNYPEWDNALTKELRSLREKIRTLLLANHQSDESMFAFFSRIGVWTSTLEDIERDRVPLWMPESNVEPITLFRLLRDRCGGQARHREVFSTPQLLTELDDENNITIVEPSSSGISAYRNVHLCSQINVPGTNLSASIDQLFFWPTLQETQLESIRRLNLEDEDPRYRLDERRGSIDLRNFPTPTLKRAVIVAGAGFGKTALLTAIAHRLSSTPWLPALVSLPKLAESGETIIEFLQKQINRQSEVSIQWHYYCDSGRSVILFDGLDELSPNVRHTILGLIQDFSNRYRNVPWLLTVRDARALSAPVDAQILKIDIFDAKQIEDFAMAYKSAGSLVDIDELFSQLRAYPDLQLLARVPLFLALLLATAQPSEPLPRKRGDLLERYLHVLFNPYEYKPTVQLSYNSMELRTVAESLAFFALEQDKINILERDVDRILQSQYNDKYSPQYISDLSICGLLNRSAHWISFTYPIVQEYLASCYLVSHFPNEIVQRFELSARRPWAQMLQFSLEQHPTVDQIVNELLKQPDDAFGITLRLIGQCILNGAPVAPSTRDRAGDRLAELWLSLPYGISENVGKLLADGFVSPLPKRVRDLLENGWGLQSGGSKIVVACNDPELTCTVLKAILAGDLELKFHLHDLQPAVDVIATDALKCYIERIRAEQTTDKEIEALASLIKNLSPKFLSPQDFQSLTEDVDLPPIIRLAGHLLGPYLISEDAFRLTKRILCSKVVDDYYRVPGWRLAVDALWRSKNSVQRWQALVCDESIPEKSRDDLLFELFSNCLESDERIVALAELRRAHSLPDNIGHTARLLQAYLGDFNAMTELADLLTELSFENLNLWVALIGKNPSKEKALNLLPYVAQLKLTSEQRVRVAGSLLLGLMWDFVIENGRGFIGLQRQSIHPAASEFAYLIWEWSQKYDGDSDGYLSLLGISLELGYQGASETLAERLTYLSHNEPERFTDFSFDNTFSNALDTLNRFRTVRHPLSLNTLEICVRISNSNTALRAIPLITAFANGEALEMLLRLHSMEEDQNIEGVWFKKDRLAKDIEELSGRLGIRIIRDGNRLTRLKETS